MSTAAVWLLIGAMAAYGGLVRLMIWRYDRHQARRQQPGDIV